MTQTCCTDRPDVAIAGIASMRKLAMAAVPLLALQAPGPAQAAAM